ncbi:MAG: glycoside hydrolase family 65 protein, partial [Lachnospiraceae bacterium]|nr:glycoside hydrolase family 65 protein [Lachnospiraceae bacterium]
FYAGIHAANMAGTWQGIVFGFAGLRTNNNRLEFHPSLPQKWKSYTFSVHYQGSVIEVHTQAGRTVYKLINDVPVTIHVDGEAAELRYEGDCYEKI